MLFSTLTLTSVLSGLVLWGSSTCPTPREVDGRLGGLRSSPAAPDLQVELRGGGTHALVLRDREGRVLAERALAGAAECDALAGEAAATIAAWVAARARLAQPGRAPLRVGHIEPAPPAADPYHLEVGTSGGAGAVPEGRGLAFAAAAELQLAPPRSGGLLCGAVTVHGLMKVLDGTREVSGKGLRVSLGAGSGVRWRLGVLALDAFILVPVSMVIPTQVDAPAPLGPRLEPAALIGVQSGIRLAGWEARFAPYVRLAVDVTFVSSGQLVVPPVTLSLGAGIAWSDA